MATEDPMHATPEPTQDTPTPAPEAEAEDAGETKTGTKKRPRIDMTVEPRERKRGKTMFGLVLGTLKKAKNEDKERNASDAAKKRQLIEQRLQDKLRKETDSVRRAEEAKKDKTTANRKEEELQLKDSIHKLRRIRLPLLSNFLLTSDVIPPVDSDAPASTNPLAPPPKTRPSPLYYLPAKLLPSQEAFLQRRKAEVAEAAEKEWEAFKEERTAGIEEIDRLRQRVAEEEARKKDERRDEPDENETGDAKMTVEGDEKPFDAGDSKAQNGDARMDVDDGAEKKDDGAAKEKDEKGAGKDEKKLETTSTPGPGYDDDAVEY
ncbi:hypothetical protein L226DRAFT_537353 [Lentinus tigrinus ALCF2SS1-7]|uniref:Pinin/SDK/MemA protein domain-containing protein n=1 Tax=Lentinus tigrinus ALCF2SS1-6 TaxID=1328759 RepID=A0A5C2S3J3_9APHY|nr:hypothetical protein L227DRAFT_577428 [Lentinus tigrinus ALCF2SS1-6]RPD72243.1 hypothetical protein L226DRAFT_537353 [Lentinus tigrinus ALCF2SS1-7]